MTAQEALDIAFAEMVVMDALPSMGLNMRPPKPAGSGIPRNPAAAKTMGGMSTSNSGDMITLAEHDEENHPGGYKGGKCTWRDANGLGRMTLAEATAKGLANKKFPKVREMGLERGDGQKGDKEAANTVESIDKPQSFTEPKPTPEMQESEARKIAEQGPAAVMQKLETETSADVLSSVQEVETDEGIIKVETTGQLAGVILAETESAKGNPEGESAITQLVEALGNGDGVPEQEQEQEETTITSTNGDYVHTLSAEEKEIIQNDPDKLPILQKIVDALDKSSKARDAVEKEQIDAVFNTLKQMFYGEAQNHSPTTAEQQEETDEPKNAQSQSQEEGDFPERRTRGNLPNYPNNPVEEGEEERREPSPPAPSDEEFRVGKDKYKVGGVVYTDVSGKGLFRTALASFMAGLRGEGIITEWDRINGTWDAMKRSEKGEMVRDGILDALANDGIKSIGEGKNLSDIAQAKLALIQQAYNEAKTPKQKMAALSDYEKWKETYSKELGDLEKPAMGQIFKPLPNAYKGTKPPLSILKTAEGFEADKEFGDKVAAGLQERLEILGFQIDDLAGVKVGPSATTVKFKIPPTFDMTAANSKKTREALKGAIGTEVANVEYAKGEKDVMAITVTNPEMRNVFFSDIMHSQKWKDFAHNAALPLPLGRDSSGEETMLDAATMPQTIVTGTTGSGKSVFISSAINGIEMEKTPSEARIVLLDPKNEFKIQDGSPHLLFPRAGGDPDKAKASKDMADVLDSLVAIMNERVTKIGGVIEGFDPSKNEFKGAAEHSIKQYNESHPDDKMPHILLVFDEIAYARDIASAADKARIDLALQKLTAVGRSVGVNCLLATQRDDVGSIPGIIQANCPGRVTFKASPTDAKASPEAKALAGNGDYILTDKGGNKTRGRGCFISPEEEMAIPSYYRDHMEGGEELAQTPSESEEKEPQVKPQQEPPASDASESQQISSSVEESEEEDWTNANSRNEAVDILEKSRKLAKQKAFETFKKSKRSKADVTKYNKAIEEANENFNSQMSIVNNQFPEQIANGDEDINQEETESAEIAEEDDDDLALFPKGEVQIDNASKSLKKQIAKWQTAMRDGEMSSEEVKELHSEAVKRIKDAKKAMKDGIDGKPATREQIDAILNPPKKKSTENASPKSQLANPTEEQMSAEKKTALEEEKKNEQRRNSVPPQKGYSQTTLAGSYEATERLTPKEQKSFQERYLPDGWEFVTDNGFKAPAKNKFGVIFVRDPQNGSYGRLIPDSQNPKGYKFQKDVDTTHPEYKGFVKKEDGSWELSPEAQKVEEETRADRKQSKDPQKRAEALKRFNRARFGHDEAPDNKAIVADAVLKALHFMEED